MDVILLIITIKNHVVLLLYSYIFLKPFHYIQVLYYRFFIHYIQSQYYYSREQSNYVFLPMFTIEFPKPFNNIQVLYYNFFILSGISHYMNKL